MPKYSKKYVQPMTGGSNFMQYSCLPLSCPPSPYDSTADVEEYHAGQHHGEVYDLVAYVMFVEEQYATGE